MSRVLKFLKLLLERPVHFMVGAGVLFSLFIGAASWVLLLVPGPHDSARQIMIARGQSLENVTRELAASGVLRSALVFSVYSRFAGPVQAGEFDLPPRASMRDISRILRVGDVVMHAITVPEGLTSQQKLHRVDSCVKLKERGINRQYVLGIS